MIVLIPLVAAKNRHNEDEIYIRSRLVSISAALATVFLISADVPLFTLTLKNLTICITSFFWHNSFAKPSQQTKAV
jgi:uncharacterized membrane protein